MSNAAEPFALARHGLPLPTARSSTLRGGWLPTASRGPEPAAPEPARHEPLHAAAPQEEEAWWAEASEWVPRDQAEAEAAAAGSRTLPSKAPASQPSGSKAEAHSVTPHEPALHIQTPQATGQAPGTAATSPLLLRQPAPSAESTHSNLAPAWPAGAAQPAASSATARAGERSPDSPVPNGTSDVPQTAPRTLSDALNTLTPKQNALVPSPQPQATLGKPSAALLPAATHLLKEPAIVLHVEQMLNGSANPSAPREIALPAHRSIREEGDVRRAGPSAPAEPVQAQAPAATTIIELHAMGSPRPAASDPRGLTPVNMAALLAPSVARTPEVHIDRVSVTVQASPMAAPPAAAAQPAAAAARNAPSQRAYRNPWAGYHNRRD